MIEYDTVQFLSYLRDRDVHIRVADGELICNAPKGALTPELRTELARRKAEILDLGDRETETEGPPLHSVVKIQTLGSRIPLFGVHSTRYRTLSNLLGNDQPMYALRYGLAKASDDEPVLPDSLEELAAHYVQEMRRVQPEGPYSMLGLCIGGIIAFEMAHQILAQGQEVALLALFDPVAPGGSQTLGFGTRFQNLFKVGAGEVLKRTSVAIRRKLRRVRPNQSQNNATDRYKAYVPNQVYPGRVCLFQPENRVSLSYEFASDLGWGRLVSGELELYEVPGDHLDMFEEPHVQVVAEKLKQCLPGPSHAPD